MLKLGRRCEIVEISKLLPQKPLLKVKEVAEVLRVTPKTIRTWCREGKMRAIRIGKEYKILRDDLERLMLEHLIPGGEESWEKR